MDAVAPWLVPLISALTVVEWATLWWLRRNGRKPALTDAEVRDRLSTIDLVIVLVAVGLFISALQYPGIASGHDARIALGVVRVTLFLLGAELLWREWRLARAGGARGG